MTWELSRMYGTQRLAFLHGYATGMSKHDKPLSLEDVHGIAEMLMAELDAAIKEIEEDPRKHKMRRTVEMETSFFDPLKTYFSMGCDCYVRVYVIEYDAELDELDDDDLLELACAGDDLRVKLVSG